jgi:hypothetical protein
VSYTGSWEPLVFLTDYRLSIDRFKRYTWVHFDYRLPTLAIIYGGTAVPLFKTKNYHHECCFTNCFLSDLLVHVLDVPVEYSTVTDNGQKYSHASNLPYIFHIKLQFFKILSWNQFTSDFNHYFIKESRKICSLYYNSNFEITFWSMFFKSPWFKHRLK